MDWWNGKIEEEEGSNYSSCQEFRAVQRGIRNVTIGFGFGLDWMPVVGPRRHSGHSRAGGLDVVLAPAINERHFGRVRSIVGLLRIRRYRSIENSVTS